MSHNDKQKNNKERNEMNLKKKVNKKTSEEIN